MLKRFFRVFENNRNGGIIFFATFFVMDLLYNYQHELFVRPHSYHSWRQTDGFCIINNYYRISMNFIHPRISQLISEDGLEMAEFPLVYYISAIGYKLFGFHEFIPRLVSLVIVLFGLWCLYRLCFYILHDHFTSVIVSLFLFTSPVVVFFSITPLPDIAAMPLSICGLYFFYRYFLSGRPGFLVSMLLCFSIAGSIKPTSIILFLALFGVYVLACLINILKPDFGVLLPRKRLIQIGVFLTLSLLLIIGWWYFVFLYRLQYHTSYFQVNANPIWEAKKEEIHDVLRKVNRVWVHHYFSKISISLVVIGLLLSLILYTKRLIWAYLYFAFFSVGCLCYFLVFFSPFEAHEYYSIVILPFAIGALLLFLYTIAEIYPAVFRSPVFKGGLLVFFIYNVAYARFKNEERINEPFFFTGDHKALCHIEPYLDSLSIHSTGLVVYWGDLAPNVAFYLMNRRGWGQWALGKCLTREGIDKCVSKGAQFLIVDQNQCTLDENQKSLIATFDSRKISDRDSIQIYKLDKLK